MYLMDLLQTMLLYLLYCNLHISIPHNIIHMYFFIRYIYIFFLVSTVLYIIIIIVSYLIRNNIYYIVALQKGLKINKKLNYKKL